MRFDTPVFFQSIIAGEYNKDTANYEKDTVTDMQELARERWEEQKMEMQELQDENEAKA
jgi:hypothetical protein